MDFPLCLRSEILLELENRSTLHWNSRGFTELPIEVLYHGQHVEQIYLKWNELINLPEWINKLEKLSNLYLFENKIRCLPESLGTLKHLSILDLQNNCLYEFPISIKGLKNLTILNLQGNGISKIPEEVEGLRSLMQFNLRGNKLKELPNTFYRLNSLQELILDENELEELPLNIVYMPNLTYLSLKSNNIYTMPFQNFLNDPQIVCTQNPYLNYISYEFGSSKTNPLLWNTDITGCKMYRRPGCENLRININDLILTMPKCLKQVYSNENYRVPSLLESALRKSYATYFNIGYDEIRKCIIELIELPNNLSEYLNNGPVGMCRFCKCPLFLECLMWFMERINIPPTGNGNMICCVPFCSLPCSKQFWLEEAWDETIGHKLIFHSLMWKLYIE